MVLGQQNSNSETRRLTMATSLFLLAGFKALAAQSQTGISPSTHGERA